MYEMIIIANKFLLALPFREEALWCTQKMGQNFGIPI
jgi:hypothetical protein